MQPGGDDLRRDAAEIVPLAPGQNGGGHLMDLGGGQNKQNVLRRLLQRLEQRIEGAGGQHVDLVDDIDALFQRGGGKGGLLPDVPDVVHAVVGGGVDLTDVQSRVLQNSPAGGAGVAGAAIDGVLAAHRPGQDLGAGGLSGAAGAGEQIGMAGAPGGHLAAQRGGDMVLAENIVKGQGPPFAVKGKMLFHGRPPFERSPPARPETGDWRRAAPFSPGQERPRPFRRDPGWEKSGCPPRARRLSVHQSHGSPDRLTAARTTYRLMLLGSPPDMVHGHALRGTGQDCHGTDDTEKGL